MLVFHHNFMVNAINAFANREICSVEKNTKVTIYPDSQIFGWQFVHWFWLRGRAILSRHMDKQVIITNTLRFFATINDFIMNFKKKTLLTSEDPHYNIVQKRDPTGNPAFGIKDPVWRSGIPPYRIWWYNL